jgi:DNA-binding MarR family transcriptional regulator
MVASRLVALVDELEERGLVERRENTEDRRRYALHLTAQGRSALEAIGGVAREHQQALLNAFERRATIANASSRTSGRRPGPGSWGASWV